MKRILVVEDEGKIARLVRDYLEHAVGVVVAGDGEVALAEARRSRPDLVVLDLGLPGRDGLDVARSLRRVSNVPIVMLTARATRPTGSSAWSWAPTTTWSSRSAPRSWWPGPGRPPAHRGRRSRRDRGAPGRRRRGRPAPHAGHGRGRPVELTPTEFQLLAAMAREPGRVFTRGQLLDAVHGVAFESYERAVDAHVKNLRKKIEPTPGHPRYLLTVHGVGYRFADA